MKYFILMFMFGLSLDAMACFAPPEEQTVEDVELIKRTARIAYAVVERREDLKKMPPRDSKAVKPKSFTTFDVKNVKRYHFKVIEGIKGEFPESKFSIVGVGMKNETKMGTFNDHQDNNFWKSSGGRSTNNMDCQIYPKFEIGVKYLIFLDEPYHWKGFEKIESESDKWLLRVRDVVKGKK